MTVRDTEGDTEGGRAVKEEREKEAVRQRPWSWPRALAATVADTAAAHKMPK